jgi:hypothetical protein
MVSVALRLGAKSQTRNASKITEGVWCAAIRGCVRTEQSTADEPEAAKSKAEQRKKNTFPRRRAPKPKGIEQFKRNRYIYIYIYITARGLTTVEIIRANSDPYTSSKLRRQKS